MSPEAVAQLQEERNRRYSDLLRNGTLLMEGVADTLSRLQNKVRMGIVTSSRREHFDIIHANTDILPYFDFVLTQEDYKGSKPDPEPFLTAMKHCRLTREECLIIEDSERGLAAANAAGIHCIIVPNKLTLNCDFTGAWRVVDNIREVTEAVLNFPAS
ncbi:MAG: HAD family hydrolase [Deltaproteobacteria bacterium]|nr:HAD family hydrolase [Deltaproteobacteria bacterium]